MARLNIPQSPRAAVFRALERIIRNDPIVSAVVRQDCMFWWNGTTTENQALVLAMAPCFRVTPTQGPSEWHYPEAFSGDLMLNVEMLVAGYDADDPINLWWAIQRAIYPVSQSAKTANVIALQQAGARNGLAEFTMPAMLREPPDSNFQHLMGQIRIAIREQLSV